MTCFSIGDYGTFRHMNALPRPTADPAKVTKGRTRARGETVALTVRLTRTDWARLHQLAVAEGISLQALAISGLSKVFAEHGLPPIID